MDSLVLAIKQDLDPQKNIAWPHYPLLLNSTQQSDFLTKLHAECKHSQNYWRNLKQSLDERNAHYLVFVLAELSVQNDQKSDGLKPSDGCHTH